MKRLQLIIALIALCFTLSALNTASPWLSSPAFAAGVGDDDPAAGDPDDTMAGEEDPDQDNGEEPTNSYFSNPAQAAHAAQLAEQSALQNDTQVQTALAAVEDAEAALAQLEKESPDDLAALEMAHQQLDAAKESYATTLSEVVGVTRDDIIGMRESGLGWGNIAHELGVHPGLLGLGRTKGKQKHYAGRHPAQDEVTAAMTQSELEEATARDTKSGWSKGHGFGIQSGVDTSSAGAPAFAAGGKSSKGKNGIGGGNQGNRGGGYSGAGGLGSQSSGNKGADSGGGQGYGKGKSDSKGQAGSKGPGNKGGSGNKGGNSSNSNKGGNGKGKK
ncbi:hypothetical protein [Desulfogranum mediterraneum]|uniref:hypothetical protein n=1 Tax=Desulfogranum mediterraneum TaxID=160661 RepID=UPI0004193719|nr:hypothetical protein [Desulfogranum mediterraneum]